MPISATRPLTVVIVDDAHDVRELLARLVGADERFEVVGSAGSVAEAAGVAAARPDLALVDVRMPDGGGPEACRSILSISPATRVVAVSAFSTPTLQRLMADAGAVAYVTKGSIGDALLDQLVGVAEDEAADVETDDRGSGT